MRPRMCAKCACGPIWRCTPRTAGRSSVSRVNYGLRFDYFNGYVPEQSTPASTYVPARQFAAVHDVPNWTDLNPRVGASYDLFGNGRTALRMSLGRYVFPETTVLTAAVEPDYHQREQRQPDVERLVLSGR